MSLETRISDLPDDVIETPSAVELDPVDDFDEELKVQKGVVSDPVLNSNYMTLFEIALASLIGQVAPINSLQSIVSVIGVYPTRSIIIVALYFLFTLLFT